MKRIKSRFFKYFANNYMMDFIAYVNEQTNILLKEKIKYENLNGYFLKDATLKRHKEWDFINKTLFQMFNEHSNTNLTELVKLYVEDFNSFTLLLKDIDYTIAYVVLTPFKEVYNQFINNNDLLENFLTNIKDFETKKKKSGSISSDTYVESFKNNMMNFIENFSADKDN